MCTLTHKNTHIDTQLPSVMAILCRGRTTLIIAGIVEIKLRHFLKPCVALVCCCVAGNAVMLYFKAVKKKSHVRDDCPNKSKL